MATKLTALLPVLLIIGIVFVSGCTETTSPEITGSQCTPNWDCSDWSPCYIGTDGTPFQSRDCKDLNNCGDTTDSPIQQDCSMSDIHKVYLTSMVNYIINARDVSVSMYILCLYGEVYEDGLIITDAYSPKIITETEEGVVWSESCDYEYNGMYFLGSIYYNKYSVCRLSGTDIQSWEESFEPITGVICGTNSYAFWRKDSPYVSIPVSILEQQTTGIACIKDPRAVPFSRTAEEFFLYKDDSVTIDGKTLKLLDVGGCERPSITVDVDGMIKTVEKDKQVTINGLTIKIVQTYYSNILAERSADIFIAG